MKKKTSLIVLLLILLALNGCGIMKPGKMPINGSIQFHDITAVIPGGFIRNSTQSSDDLWIFEKGMYSKYIIIKRSDADENADAFLDEYVQYMIDIGAESSRGEFLYADAVLSTYTKDDLYCQEILFVYNSSYYSFALRGGTEEEFQELLNNLNTPDTVNETLRQEEKV